MKLTSEIGTAITKQVLLQQFLAEEPDLNDHTFSWRIHDLCQRQVLQAVGRGKYTASPKPIFRPLISPEVRKLASKIRQGFGDVSHCLLETDWLNGLSRHQATTSIVVVEIEKDSTESLFHYLRDAGYRNVFLKPSSREMDLYVANSQRPIVILPLVSRSPIETVRQDKREYLVPQLEKILTDLFCDQNLFFFWVGEEMRTIFKNAASRYAINYTTMLSYASRRGKQAQLRLYLLDVLGKEFQELFP